MKTKIAAAILALIFAASLFTACGKSVPSVPIETLLPDLTAALTEEPSAAFPETEPADSVSAAGTDTAPAAETETAAETAEEVPTGDETDDPAETEEEIPDSEGDFKFRRTADGETWLDSYSGKASTVVIPAEDPADGSPVAGIDVWAFRDSETVKKIVVPDSVKTIEKNAFMYCAALEEIELPDGLETLGDQAFYRCSALKKVSVPEGVEKLGYATFMFCESLEEITLPKSLKEIGDSVFSHCGALLTINYRGPESDWWQIDTSESAMPPTRYTNVYDYAG
ncbi:MAG: leucine-rich repeat domain-containing protein [Clostridia bacterium]|nr:leucine-rich repeat domain-containing protein [Clostridia bacterium]